MVIFAMSKDLGFMVNFFLSLLLDSYCSLKVEYKLSDHSNLICLTTGVVYLDGSSNKLTSNVLDTFTIRGFLKNKGWGSGFYPKIDVRDLVEKFCVSRES